MRKSGNVIILHNIRSAHNVGSLFRTADAVGVEVVYISGYTPAPKDRFGRKRGDIAKTALGAEEIISWKKVPKLSHAVESLKKSGYRVVGVEQGERAIDYKAFNYADKKPLAFIFGNEVRGLSQPAQALCDVVLEIPMRGGKESLNVAVAAGIILFKVIDG